MKITVATRTQVEPAVTCLVEAFGEDPYMRYFFPGEPELRNGLVHEFFKCLMEARLALGMPVLLAAQGGRIEGVVMGDDTGRPDWLPSDASKWAEFESAHEGLVERFAHVEALKARLEPQEPHYYLGVLGVMPTAQGQGMGTALVDAFSQLSDTDPRSTGTLLETATHGNLSFYRSCGFNVIGQNRLDAATSLWLLFRPKH
ncbi:MAG: GNAT family N-acetyltransferase [Aestuariivirga sp.]